MKATGTKLLGREFSSVGLLLRNTSPGAYRAVRTYAGASTSI